MDFRHKWESCHGYHCNYNKVWPYMTSRSSNGRRCFWQSQSFTATTRPTCLFRYSNLCKKLFSTSFCHTQSVKVFDSSRGLGHSISCVSHRGVINGGLITARSPDLGKSVWSVHSWLAYPLKKHCCAPPLVSQAEMPKRTHLTLTLRTHYHQSSYFLYIFLSPFLLYSDSSGRFQQCAELGGVCLLPSSSGGDPGVPAAWSEASSPAAPTANAAHTACMYNKSYSESWRPL